MTGMKKEHCRFIHEHFSQYRENVLTVDEFTGFENHLKSCGECRVFTEQQQRLSDLLRSVSFEKPVNADDAENTKLEQKLVKTVKDIVHNVELTDEALDMAAGGGDGSNTGNGNQGLCPLCNKPLTPEHQC